MNVIGVIGRSWPTVVGFIVGVVPNMVDPKAAAVAAIVDDATPIVSCGMGEDTFFVPNIVDPRGAAAAASG